MSPANPPITVVVTIADPDNHLDHARWANALTLARLAFAPGDHLRLRAAVMHTGPSAPTRTAAWIITTTAVLRVQEHLARLAMAYPLLHIDWCETTPRRIQPPAPPGGAGHGA